jgi:large-conductance mechanosensitive channel
MFKKILNWIEENIIFVVSLIATIVIPSYLIKFSNFSICHPNFSTTNGDWGTFGDYIGGILNPIIAFCALYWIVKTYHLQNEELKDTKKELEIANKTQKKQVELAALTALLNTKLMQLDGLNSEIQIPTNERKSLHVNTPPFNGNKVTFDNVYEKLTKEINSLSKKKEELKSDINELQNKLNNYLL